MSERPIGILGSDFTTLNKDRKSSSGIDDNGFSFVNDDLSPQSQQILNQVNAQQATQRVQSQQDVFTPDGKNLLSHLKDEARFRYVPNGLFHGYLRGDISQGNLTKDRALVATAKTMDLYTQNVLTYGDPAKNLSSLLSELRREGLTGPMLAKTSLGMILEEAIRKAGIKDSNGESISLTELMKSNDLELLGKVNKAATGVMEVIATNPSFEPSLQKAMENTSLPVGLVVTGISAGVLANGIAKRITGKGLINGGKIASSLTSIPGAKTAGRATAASAKGVFKVGTKVAGKRVMRSLAALTSKRGLGIIGKYIAKKGLMRAGLSFLGPIGLAAMTIWTVYDIANYAVETATDKSIMAHTGDAIASAYDGAVKPILHKAGEATYKFS